MENKLMIFENEAFGKVRTLNLNGEPWFVAADVCKALELGNPSMTVERLDDDEKGISTIDTLGGKQRMAIINEPGLYSLVITSRKPEAKAFKRWITHEVIPAIRKHGAYMTKSVLEQVLENPELVLLMAQRMLEEQRKNELLQQELRLAKPKADFYDAFIHPECCTNLRATAKELKVPEKMFTAFLIRKRYLYRACALRYAPALCQARQRRSVLRKGLYRRQRASGGIYPCHAQGQVAVSHHAG